MHRSAKLVVLLSAVMVQMLVSACASPQQTPSTTTQRPTTPQTAAKTPTATPQQSKVSAGIRDFVARNSEFGAIREVSDMPDWADGKRYKVTTSTGTYLFYLYGNDVVGVYRYDASGGRTKVFSKDYATPVLTNAPQSSSQEIPAYTVISKVKLLGGGAYGDILIEEFSRATPAPRRESVLKAIAAQEGLTQAALYSTTDAYEANMSASYLKQNPNALKQGFLGSLSKAGEFTPGEKWYP